MKYVRAVGSIIGLATVCVLTGCASGGGGSSAPPATAAGTVEWIASGLAENDPTVVWDALPASYQSDVQGVVHEFAAKVNPEVWNQSVGVLQKAVGVVKHQKQFILNSSMMSDDFDLERADTDLDAATTVLDTVFSSEIADVETLKTIDLRKFLTETGSTLMEQGKQLSDLAPDQGQGDFDLLDLAGVTATELTNEDGVVTLKIEAPDREPQEVPFVQVEERWIPQEMAAEWPGRMAEMRSMVEGMDPETGAQSATQIKMFLSMLDGFLDQLDTADSQEQFDQRVKEGGGPLLFGAMMLGAESGLIGDGD